jgi:RND family efflux transporter MFP subunit
MSGLDIFAWIVLIILIASVIAVFCIAGWLPGHIAKTRGHPHAQAVTVAGWVTLICGFALWPVALVWAYVDVPARAREGAAAMMIALMAVYLVLLFVLVRFGIVSFNLFWKCSPFIVLLLLNLLLFIPMGWGAPQGSALVVRNAVSIIPNVAGEVIDVPVEGNAALKTGDVLFRIDPVPYEAQVRAIEAQLKLSTTRLAQMTQLFERDSGRGFDVEQRQSEVDQLKAQLEGAKWNLDKTVVRAPADGYATNVALRKGARVGSSPVMAFIDTSETLIGVEISQNDARYIAPGQPVELTFKLMPGTVYSGEVETVLQAISTGQTQASGLAVTPKAVESAPFVVRVKLDDQELSKRLPAGSTGTVAIFTEAVKPTHIIRKVLLRQIAILNYVNPF